VGECDLISLRELARRTGVSLREARRWRDEEGMPAYRTGKRRQSVVWQEFKEWLKSRSVANGPKVTQGS